ncbi:hypothetical protein COT42_06840 [Candidatus Saganbacteria bacterium CG08_land_8_20_14_0_20_45_16]|uniref:Segregation and condensation protein A n=1 Tax=Candidatus Saganbacteria bacterium CG08_land_8_20_14_0_20_45_16 TaxID=2014293 RepID=A0A2H0XVF0_UNCSA|nr:MAG: hypothetical protein COT42_06840 [Candidatus Saganbacteria bacterium CG08_land_8_20_14_0_20_45_16]
MVKVAYQVIQEAYQGPFDLLLKAIDDGQLDVFRVSIAQIISSYLSYWQQSLDLLGASDFLIMAAYLLELKSRALLPAKEEPEVEALYGSIEDSLVSHLQEYAIYKNLAATLRQRKEVYEHVYGRHEGEQLEKEIDLVDVSLQDLVLAFKKAYDLAAKRQRFRTIVEDEITLEVRLMEVRKMIEDQSSGVPLEELFFRGTRLEVVVTFLAILELAKQFFIRIIQGSRFAEILIVKRKEQDDGNFKSASLGQDQNDS